MLYYCVSIYFEKCPKRWDWLSPLHYPVLHTSTPAATVKLVVGTWCFRTTLFELFIFRITIHFILNSAAL